ncbi:MerR family transcriptional regulator [Rubinisphaera sp. JC750]|uniref:MerR family transcriptional regulator n=1 Tax=Rubinisphaera sp. JC750 TaxID=2898658 RepID=UPI003965721B
MQRHYSLRHVAQRLKVAPHRIVYLFTSGKVPEPDRISGRRLFTESDIKKIAEAFGKEVRDV